MTTPLLRAMTASDVTAVLAMEKILYPVDAWSGAQFLEELRGVPATRYYLVVEDEGVIIGYAGLMVVGEHADIQTLSVAKSHQGRGIGQLLLQALESEAKRRRAEAIFLEVRTDNEQAKGLYFKSGYQELGRRDNYYAPGIDALTMRKVLS